MYEGWGRREQSQAPVSSAHYQARSDGHKVGHRRFHLNTRKHVSALQVWSSGTTEMLWGLLDTLQSCLGVGWASCSGVLPEQGLDPTDCEVPVILSHSVTLWSQLPLTFGVRFSNICQSSPIGNRNEIRAHQFLLMVKQYFTPWSSPTLLYRWSQSILMLILL